MAVTVEGYLDKVNKFDPRYVKLIVRSFGKNQGVNYEQVLDYHNCTEEDFQQFNPIHHSSENQFKAIKDDPDRGLICFDYPDDLYI